MDWLEFVAKSEWPAVVAGALLLYRKPLTRILDQIRPKKFKGFGIESEFEPNLDRAEALTATPPPVVTPEAVPIEATPEPTSRIRVTRGPAGAIPFPERYKRLLPLSRLGERPSPDTTVIRAYSTLSEFMETCWRAFKGNADPPRDLIEVGKAIGFTDDELGASANLRVVRDDLAHTPEASMSADDAWRFTAITERLLGRTTKLYEAWRENQPSAPLADG